MTNQPSKPLDDLSQPIDKLRGELLRFLRVVRDDGALDDNHGGEDWRRSDKTIDEAADQILKSVEAEIVEARIDELRFWVRVLDEKDKYFFHSINADKLQTTLKDRISTLKGEALKQPNQSNQDGEV